MNKHRAKHKKHHSRKNSKQAGFLSFSIKDFMSKNDKILISVIGVGVLLLLILSAVLIINRDSSQDQDTATTVSPTPERRVTTPYPTVPEEIEQATIMVNRRSITPQSITIQAGGSVGFYNEDEITVSIQGYNNSSDMLNVGPIEPLDVPTVQFENPGVYEYVNPENPEDVAEIIVSE